MGQQLSLAAEGQESAASFMAQNSEASPHRSQSQRDSHQGQSQSYTSGLSEQNSNLAPQRQVGPRKNVVAKESSPAAIPVEPVSAPTDTVSTAAAVLVNRVSRHDTDLGRMSVREAIDSFIESRLSATNDSPPPPPVSTSLGFKGVKTDDSRSSSWLGDDSKEKTGSDRLNGMEARDLTLDPSKGVSDDSYRKDTPQTATDGKENGASTNDALDEESERMSDMELVIDCDATESPQSVSGRSESLPPSKEREGNVVATKDTADDLPTKDMNEPKDLKDKDADKTAGDDGKKNSPSAKEEKQTFSSYLQDRLKAQLASHVDTEAQGHLYLWDVNKSNAASNAHPVSSPVTRTGSVRLQTLIDKVLDQSIGKSLCASPSESDSSPLFMPVKPNSESSSSSSDIKSMDQSPSSAYPGPSRTQNNSSAKSSLSQLCFKDHIEKVVVENFLSYEEEEAAMKNNDSRWKREERAASTGSNPTSTPNSESDSSKAKRETTGGVGPNGTISVQHIVDRVISQTEVISKLLTPGASDQNSERMSPARGSAVQAVSSSSPSSVSSAPPRSTSGSHASSEGHPTGGNSGQASVGRKRGRPRLSSPVSRPNTWSNDRNPTSAAERSNVVFRDLQTGDYRATPSALLHGRQGGPPIPSKPPPRLAPGQGPPPIDLIPSQGSIQHGIPIRALVPQQPSAHMYHSSLHPHHAHAQQHPSPENPNPSARPIMTSSVPPPHSPHLTSYHPRGLHHPGPHSHGPQPPSPHGHAQHHHRPSDHLTNHHPSHNKPLPPLIHANHIQDRHIVSNNSSSIASSNSTGSRVSNSGGLGSSRLVPVSHIPTASCSCPNCVAIYSRDKPLQVPASSPHHQQQHIRRGDVGIPSHIPSSKLSDTRADDPRSHPHHSQPYAAYENTAAALASHGEHLTAPSGETLNPVVAVGSKVVPPQAVIPTYIARRPMALPPALEHHPREEQHYPRDGKPAPYPYSPQAKPSPSDSGYSDDERYRAWQRAQTSDPHVSHPNLPYPPYEPVRKPSSHGHGRQSPEKSPRHQPQPLDLKKSGYPHPEGPLSNSNSSPANADQPLDLSIKPSSSTDQKNREPEAQRPTPTTVRTEAFYQDPGASQGYPSSHVPPRETDPPDTYRDVEAAGRSASGRPENAVDRPAHPVHAYHSGHRTFAGPPSSHPLAAPYHQHTGLKAPPLHPSQVYPAGVDSRANAQAASERPPYHNNGHLLSPSNPAANSRESPTHRSRHPYAPYPLPLSSTSSSPSLQLQQQPPQQPQPQHPVASQPPGLSIPQHLRGSVGPSPGGGNTQYQRRSPYSDLVRQPKHQDPRAPSPHYPSVGSHPKTTETHNYSGMAGSQDTAEVRGAHGNIPPPHPQPGVSPDDPDALKHSVSKHEPIQNIIGNHPQNDILYLICKLCRQTYGSPYGFRKHFRNQHGFEPKVEHTIVQTISATKTAMAHTGPGDQPITDAEKKGILYSDSHGPQAGEVPMSYNPEFSSSPVVIDKHSQDATAMPGKVQDDQKLDSKTDLKPVDCKTEAGLENTKFLECPECGQTFQLNDFGSYKRHCRQHSVNQYSGPFSCHDCQKSFAEPGQLQQHLNTHKSFTPSLCGFCPTFFSSPHYLAVHLQAAHGHVVSSESLKKSSDEAELKPGVQNEKAKTIDLHTMIENALKEINVPHCSQSAIVTSTKTSSSTHNVASSSSNQEHASVVSSSISSFPLPKRHRMAVASTNSPVLTTVHTPKKLEVQKLPADAVVTTASPDSSYEEGKGQPTETQPRLSTSTLKSGRTDLVPSPLNFSNSNLSQGEAKEPSFDSQDSNHSISLASGGAKKDENGSRIGGQTDKAMLSEKAGSNKDDTESVSSDRCQSVDSNSQSVGESRTSSPGCDDAEKFYKHKKYSRHRKRISSSDVQIELDAKNPKLSISTTTYDNEQTSAGSVSSTNNAKTIVQMCESSSGHYEGRNSASGRNSSCSSQEDGGSGKLTPKSGKCEKKAKEGGQEDGGMYGGKCPSDGSKKGEGGEGMTKYKWDRLTRSQTGKSPQAVSYSNA